MEPLPRTTNTLPLLPPTPPNSFFPSLVASSQGPFIKEAACFGDELGGGEAGGADAASDERVGGCAVQADGVAQRTRAVQALAEERAHDASEHVARAAAREPRVSGRVDRPITRGCRADAARALQDHVGVEASRELERAADAIGLHLARVDAEQARRLAGVRGHH